MNSYKTIEKARQLFEELKEILDKENESNWIRGIKAAIACLEDSNIERGYSKARSIYTTMTAGQGAFADYYIQRSDSTEQVNENRRLDEIREQLWQLLQGT
jgi:hypothetical protein